MNKRSEDSQNEIDLIELIEIFWKEKIKIISIIIITVGIFFGYDQLKPKPVLNIYKISTNIKASNDKTFIRFIPIQSYFDSEYFQISSLNKLESDEYFQSNTIKNQNYNKSNLFNMGLLKSFVEELLDYEELIYVLEKNKTISEKFSKLTKSEKKIKINEYSKSFEIEQSEQKGISDYYTLSFTSEDINQSKEILDQTIKLAINNLESSIFAELNLALDEIKKKKLFSDARMIEFLSEQSSIAEALSLKDNYIQSTDDNLSFNISIGDSFYYLKGKKVIDKEIDIIKNRKYTELTYIKNQINLLKEMDINWVDYNPNLLDIKNLTPKSSVNILPLSFVLGSIIGLIFALISNRSRLKKIVKK